MGAPNFNPKKQAAAFGPSAFDIVAFTIGAEGGNIINVACQLKDARGNNVGQVVVADVFLSDASTGIGVTATALTTPPSIGTNGTLLEITITGKAVRVQSDASGRFDLQLPQTATPTYYLVVVLPDGSIAVSSAITFA